MELDIPELEEHFCKQAAKKAEEENEEKNEKKVDNKPKEVNLLDPKIQQNVGIALAKYRMPGAEIREAVLHMDEEKLDLEKVSSLRTHAPTPDDIHVLKEYDGDHKLLGKVEKFFLEIIDIPRYSQRLDCFIYKLKFRTALESMQEQIETVMKAVNQMQTSSKFMRVLEVVLALGNYLNGGTPRGGLYGFKLEGLLKLSTVKSLDNKQSLMNYVIAWAERHDPELLGLGNELNAVGEAMKIPLTQVTSDLQTLQNGMELVKQQIQAAEADPAPEDRFVDVMAPFLKTSEKQLDSLKGEFKSLQDEFNALVELHGEDKTKSSTEEFFGMIQSFVDQFDKAYKENEKRRILAEKAAKKLEAEEKMRQAKAARKRADSQLANLVDDVFGNLKNKKADEIVGSLAGSSGRKSRGSTLGRNGPGHHRTASQERLHEEEEEVDEADTEALRLASMMSRLQGQSSNRNSGTPNGAASPTNKDSETASAQPAGGFTRPRGNSVADASVGDGPSGPARRGSIQNSMEQNGELEAFFKRKREGGSRRILKDST